MTGRASAIFAAATILVADLAAAQPWPGPTADDMSGCRAVLAEPFETKRCNGAVCTVDEMLAGIDTRAFTCTPSALKRVKAIVDSPEASELQSVRVAQQGGKARQSSEVVPPIDLLIPSLSDLGGKGATDSDGIGGNIIGSRQLDLVGFFFRPDAPDNLVRLSFSVALHTPSRWRTIQEDIKSRSSTEEPSHGLRPSGFQYSKGDRVWYADDRELGFVAVTESSMSYGEDGQTVYRYDSEIRFSCYGLEVVMQSLNHDLARWRSNALLARGFLKSARCRGAESCEDSAP